MVKLFTTSASIMLLLLPNLMMVSWPCSYTSTFSASQLEHPFVLTRVLAMAIRRGTYIQCFSLLGLVAAGYALYVEAQFDLNPDYEPLCNIGSFASCTKVELAAARPLLLSRLHEPSLRRFSKVHMLTSSRTGASCRRVIQWIFL
jgi:hypothetical protein